MRELSTKVLREQTIGEASRMHKAADGRDFTAAEQAKFDALLETWNAVARESAPKERNAFSAFASQRATPFHDTPEGREMGAKLGAMLASGAKPDPFTGMLKVPQFNRSAERTMFIDQNGHYAPLVEKGDSFAAAVREQAERNGRKLETELVDDGLTLGGFCRALAVGPRTPVEYAAMSGSSATAGGYVVPDVLAAETIDLMRARSVMFQAGSTIIPLESETHSFARLTGDPTPSWRREATDVAESDMTFGRINFHAKSLAVLVKASRELVQDAPNIDQLMQRSIASALALEVDRVGMFGEGATEPLGLYEMTDINEIATIGATMTNHDQFLDGWKLMLDDNAPDPTAAIISNREWLMLAKLTSGDGQPVNLPPVIANLPRLHSSAVSTTLGAGANESAAFIGYFPDFVYGFRSQIQIEVLKELFAGTLQVGFLAHLRVDTNNFHGGSFCKLTGITG